MSRRPKIFNELEVFLKAKFPNFVQNVLINCGFDCALSIKLINVDTINQLEEYINKNKYLLKNTIYREDEEFKFSIGHKLLILSLPKYLEQFQKEKEVEKNIEISKENIDSNVLKNILLKLKNYATKFNYNFIVSEQYIERFGKTEFGYKCHVKCSICNTLCSCLFKKNSWNISNFTNHVKLHYPFVPQPKESVNQTVYVTVSTQNTSENLVIDDQSIQRVNNSELDNILDVSIFV